jgi:uncharacterized protein YjlB
MPKDAPRIAGAEVVLPCRQLDETLTFLCDRLGFRVLAVYPADAPTVAVVERDGLRVRLDGEAEGGPGVLRFLCDDPVAVGDGETELVAPNGTRIDLVNADAAPVIPALQPSLVVTRLQGDAGWTMGRAGMRYRDLVPDRQGGRFIASHIQIPGGGPVPDYPHFHKVRFQVIYCYRGQVRVAYEGQGPPFVMAAGDCVLQPPRIRHRVLESSPDLEVVEVGCPAAHETLADHDCTLPTDTSRPDRQFEGQRFVRHVAEAAVWAPQDDGFEVRDTEIAVATDGLADVVVLRRGSGPLTGEAAHRCEFHFTFVLAGTVRLDCDGSDGQPLGVADACVVPAGLPFSFKDPSADLELLRVTLPSASGLRSSSPTG